MAFHIIITGELMPGFQKDDVVTNLCEIGKLSREDVENKMLIGKRLTVKKLDSTEEAEHYHLALLCAGVEAEMEER